ncbi:hypothetical protein Bca4012_091948 [Brassica carinata]
MIIDAYTQDMGMGIIQMYRIIKRTETPFLFLVKKSISFSLFCLCSPSLFSLSSLILCSLHVSLWSSGFLSFVLPFYFFLIPHQVSPKNPSNFTKEGRNNKGYRRTMVFSSNWSQPTNSNHHQHQLHENGSLVSGHGLLSQQLPTCPPNPNPNNHYAAVASGLPARLGGSMAERARQAKAPPPEGALKCPRCDSINTKFCYYNNYNLTQPRYFCKACRRYWTRGGALRNVPVGGGCRKNSKKGKNGNSKSSSSSSKQSSSTVNDPSSNSGQLRPNYQFPFLPTLHNLTQLGGIGLNLAATNGNNQGHEIGSSLMNDLGFLHVGNGRNIAAPISGNIHDNNNNGASSLMGHFSLFDPTTGLHAFQNGGNIVNNVGISFSSTSMVDSRAYQAAPVKMEEQPGLVNLSRPVSGLTSPGNLTNQYLWNSSDFSGPSSNDHHQLL